MLIVMARLNISFFHTGVYRTVKDWDLNTKTPITAKFAAVFSVLLWTGVIIAGRLLAYI